MDIHSELILDIIAEASTRLHKEIRDAYKENRLENYLMSIDMQDLLPQESDPNEFKHFCDGIILIVGDSNIDANNIYGCAKSLGFSKDRLELCLGYEKAKSFNYKKLEYNAKYYAVLVGPMPHSTLEKGDSSSVITMMESSKGYPKVIRLIANSKLKITNNNFKAALEKLIETGYVVA